MFRHSTSLFLWQKGVQITGADKAGIYMNIVPLSAALFAILFKEYIHTYHLIGGVCIVVGLFISKSSTSKFFKALS
ncbi:EamA family transporter [Flagellimonas hymeniacidonis]|uniref:EamA family transporter n=1 Tax=Flagellimonas hymeniacidonis TaxID=2603628 RepID=A0A5C8V6H2_9FLAO|nr:EamA family transporter [Flagellimonas hymeniacidonis]